MSASRTGAKSAILLTALAIAVCLWTPRTHADGTTPEASAANTKQVSVSFEDPMLELSIRYELALLGIDPGPTWETTDLVGVGFTRLDAHWEGISNLSGRQSVPLSLTVNRSASPFSTYDRPPLS